MGTFVSGIREEAQGFVTNLDLIKRNGRNRPKHKDVTIYKIPEEYVHYIPPAEQPAKKKIKRSVD